MDIMQRSTPINALRRDEVQDPQTRDMVDGILNELEYSGGGGLPGGGGGFPGEQYEGMHGNPQMMDYGAPPDGGGFQGGGGYSQEFGGGSVGLPPGDPRGGGQFPGDGQYAGGPPQMQQQYQDRGPPQQPPQEYIQQMQGPPPNMSKGSSGFIGGLTDLFAANSKEPMLAAALFLIMSNDTVSMLLSKYIPYASSGMVGLLIRAVVVAVLFFLAKVFVLRR